MSIIGWFELTHENVEYDELIHSTPRRYRAVKISDLDVYQAPGGLAEVMIKRYGFPMKKSWRWPFKVEPDWNEIAFVIEYPCGAESARWVEWGYRRTQRDPVRHEWIEDRLSRDREQFWDRTDE